MQHDAHVRRWRAYQFAEIAGLRDAQHAIDKLAAVKRAARN